MKKIVLIICLLATQITFGQDFNREAALPAVDQKGFYNILLTPEISSHLKPDWSDIRIYSSNGKEVPYILKSESSSLSNSFKEYTIMENQSVPKCCTRLILHNASKSKINNLSLIIKNSDVRKKARLSGSDDRTNWYIIKDDYRLESIYNNQHTSEVKILDFPLSDYEYYKLDIDDSLNAPVKILKAGYYDSRFEEAKYLTLPAPAIQQKDSSDKSSYVQVSFNSAHFIDRIKVAVKSPEYFLRPVRIAQKIQDNKRSYFETLKTAELKSNHDNIIYLDYAFTKELYLIIDNNDNQPLEIESINGYQLTHYLTAKLEKDKKYLLRFGNKKLSYPQYDLRFFKDSIPGAVTVLKAQSVINIEKKESKVSPNDFFSSTLWIWIAIVLVVALLGYMTFKMMKEIK